MIKIENNNEFNVGDRVWWFNAWGVLESGIISTINEGERSADGDPVVHIKSDQGAQTGAKLCNCWPTEMECLKAEAERARLQKAEYKEAITDVHALVRFLFENDVCSENRDYEAAAAAKERAKELLNIDIAE